MGVIWDRIKEKARDIDAWRKIYLTGAEMVDAWRLIPRAIVAIYIYMMWELMMWYMKLAPYMIKDCDVELLKEACIVKAPNTEHMAFVTAVFAVSAGVFALYAKSGKTWNGFTPWNTKNLHDQQVALAPKLVGGRRKEDPPVES